MTSSDSQVSDANGNICQIKFFGSRKAAQEALDSLIDCIDCVNCTNCVNCQQCFNCKNCRDCLSCFDSEKCDQCAYSTHCSGCEACFYSDRLTDCQNYYTCHHVTRVPVVYSIHTQVYQEASQPDALQMDGWHKCNTTHCRAGWVVILAGKKGKELETRIGSESAALMIYHASSKLYVNPKQFYVGNEAALADMKRMADLESAR